MSIFISRKSLIILLVTLTTVLFATLTYAGRDITETTVGPGVEFTKIIDSDGPLGIYVLKVDLQNPYIDLVPVMAKDMHPGREQVLMMSLRNERPNHRVVAGINTDFWADTAPLGLFAKDGDVLKSPYYRSSIAFDENKNPKIDVFAFNASLTTEDGKTYPIDGINKKRGNSEIMLFSSDFGKTTEATDDGFEKYIYIKGDGPRRVPAFGTFEGIVKGADFIPRDSELSPEFLVLSAGETYLNEFKDKLKDGAKLTFNISTIPSYEMVDAVTGGPRILRDGKVSVENAQEKMSEGFSTTRHPRTAIGYSADKRYLFMAVVDGRQTGYSRGVSLDELAKMMKDFGCYDAMNLDGGGSSTMIVRNKVANRPSDATGPRFVCSGLLVVSTAPDGPPAHLHVTPDDKNITIGSSVKLSVSATDEYYNPVKIEDPISWKVTRGLGSFDKEKQTFTADNKAGEVTFTAKIDKLKADASVMIKSPAKLEVSPSPLILEPGEKAELIVKAYDNENNKLILRQDLISYSINEGDIGTLEGSQLTAGDKKASGSISVKFADIEEIVPVKIGESVTVSYEDFENLDDWTLSILMGGDKGSFGTTDMDPKQGKYAGVLQYDMERASGVSAFYMAPRNPAISGTPEKVILWLKWNGSDSMFRGTLKDADGDKWFLDFNAVIGLDWKDEWREIEYPFNKVLKHWDNKTNKEIPAFPIELQNLYLAQPITQDKGKGTIFIDDLRIVYRYGQQGTQ